ncbi:XdhC family protein [Streptomyces mirabilis]
MPGTRRRTVRRPERTCHGAALAVDVDGTVIGSVSGGCVEAAVYL